MTQSDMDHYREHGYVILRGVVPTELLDRVAAESAGLLDGSLDTEGFAAGAASTETPDDPGRLIQQVSVRTWPPRQPAIAELAALPVLRQIAATLMDCQAVRLFQWQMLQKEPGHANATPWHQDEHYWRWLERLGVAALTTWMPLLPTDAASGTMWLLPDSHRDGVHPHDRAGGVSRFQTITTPVDEAGMIPLDLAPGDLSVHHQCLVHGARANTGGRRRMAVAQHYRALTADELLATPADGP